MHLLLKIFKVLFLTLLLIKPSFATITEDLLKLSKMYDDGILTSEEFSKAKSILLELDEIESADIVKSKTILTDPEKNKSIKKKITKKKITKKKIIKKVKSVDDIKIERIFTTTGSKFTNKSFEKMKLTVGDFSIYTHRPGAIKIKKISNNKQYAVIGDKLDIKFYNNGEDILDIEVDKKIKKLILKFNNSKTLVWKGQYVKKAEATFYQILGMGRIPFHYYIKLDAASTAVALNMEKFNRRIELAIIDKKKELSSQYNISISQIDEVIEQNDMMAAYGEIIPINNTYDVVDQKKLVLYSDLKDTIGEDNFNILNKDIDTDINKSLNKSVSSEVSVAIDESIRDAINSGIESSALEAGLNALIDALMAGESWADALAAGGNACGC